MADERVDDGVTDVLLMSFTGSVSQYSEEDVVAQGSGLCRDDKRRNAQLARLPGVGASRQRNLDLADEKQALVLTDHDSQVLARRRVRPKTGPRRGGWDPVLEWARQQAHRHGLADVTVGCEPTGHRWRVRDRLARPIGYGVGVCSRCCRSGTGIRGLHPR